MISSINSSEKSPCTTISSWFWLFLATDDPQANLFANSFAAFFKSTPIHAQTPPNQFFVSPIYPFASLPNMSNPWIVVMRFRFVRSTRLMVTREDCDREREREKSQFGG